MTQECSEHISNRSDLLPNRTFNGLSGFVGVVRILYVLKRQI